VDDFREILKASILSSINSVRTDLNLSSKSARQFLAKDIYRSIISEYNARLPDDVEAIEDELVFEDE